MTRDYTQAECCTMKEGLFEQNCGTASNTPTVTPNPASDTPTVTKPPNTASNNPTVLRLPLTVSNTPQVHQ